MKNSIDHGSQTNGKTSTRESEREYSKNGFCRLLVTYVCIFWDGTNTCVVVMGMWVPFFSAIRVTLTTNRNGTANNFAWWLVFECRRFTCFNRCRSIDNGWMRDDAAQYRRTRDCYPYHLNMACTQMDTCEWNNLFTPCLAAHVSHCVELDSHSLSIGSEPNC